MRGLFPLLVLLFGSVTVCGQESSQSLINPPKVVEAFAPAYPEEAISRSAEGRVVVSVRINSKGTVESAKVLHGPRLLAPAALAAAKRWRFDEDPVKRITELAFVFLLSNRLSENRVSFVPPNQIEIVDGGWSRRQAFVNETHSEDNKLPKVVRSVAPAYPSLARLSHSSGLVVVQATVDSNGKVIRATAKGHPLLQAATVAAARQWEFESSGHTEERLVTLSFVFHLPPDRKTSASFTSPYQVDIFAKNPHIDISNGARTKVSAH